MKSSKTTRRALLGSLTSLLLCFAMLIGSTFAWFTDSASTSINKIQSGNLDIEVYHKIGTDASGADQWEKIDGATNLFDNVNGEPILWEPGAVATETFKIVNEGSLALKFEFWLNYANATKTSAGKSLADALTYEFEGFVNTDPNSDNHLEDAMFENYLMPDAAQELTVNIAWEPTANDNDFNVEGGLSIDLGINVLATQYTYESDSNGNQYDADAEYPEVVRVANNSELSSAITSAQPGQIIALNPGSSYTLPSTVGENVEINGNGATVTVPVSEGFNRVYSGATFKNVVFDDSTNKLWIKGAATFVNCTFKCAISDAEPVVGTVTFENCTFNKAVHFAPASASGVPTTGKFFEAKDCTFTGNLTVQGFERVTLTDCTLTGSNWAGANMISYCPVTFNSCTLANGVRLASGMTAADVTCNNCTIQVKLPAA